MPARASCGPPSSGTMAPRAIRASWSPTPLLGLPLRFPRDDSDAAAGRYRSRNGQGPRGRPGRILRRVSDRHFGLRQPRSHRRLRCAWRLRVPASAKAKRRDKITISRDDLRAEPLPNEQRTAIGTDYSAPIPLGVDDRSPQGRKRTLLARYVFGDELKPGERWKRRLLTVR
jgi:hypothetical protein